MKTISLITALSILSIPALAKIEVPTKAKDGFVNVNNRKEYDFSNYPNEKIWHEFGRPFWKATPKKAEVSAPVKAEAPKVVDTDRDGIEDSLDQCPNTMANTVVNSFGCKPKENKVSENIDLNVRFHLGKATINEKYTDAINKLGSYLKRNADSTIEIQGHTDTTGALSFNEELSKKRAIAIKEYLKTKYDIPSDRLKTVGFGPKKPVASNKTLEGRKKNRRVEVEVIR